MSIERALEKFDARAFTAKHGGHKESASDRSHEYLLPCPYCFSSRLRWNHPTKKAWQCWGCHKSGSTVDLICLLEQCSLTRAYEMIEDGYVGGDADFNVAPITLPPPRVLTPIAWPRGVDALTVPCAPHARAWQYLAYRGLTVEDVARYRIGFGRVGRLHNYIVFPIFIHGQIVFWQARATWDAPAEMLPEDRKLWIRGTQYRKTLNPTVHAGEAGGGEVLFNFDGVRGCDHVVICEGPIDAIKAGPNAVALLGKVAQPAKLSLLRSLGATRFTVYLDRGNDERTNAVKLAGELSAWAHDVRIATPPEGHDPGSLPREINAQVVAGAEIVSKKNDYFLNRIGHL